MRFLTIPKGKGHWAGIFLIIGLTAFVCAAILVLANVLFSALGVMLFSGGKVVWDYSNALFPTFNILSGGRIGLLIGLVGGILACISQMRLWIIPAKGGKTISERKGLFYLLSVAFVLYDILSTYYFINSGTFFDGSQGILNGIGAMFLAGGVAIAMFSVGPIIFLVWSLETIIENHAEGFPSIGRGLTVFLSFFVNIAKSFQKIADWEVGTEDNTEKIKENVQQSQRGRGRPSNRDYSEPESESI